MNLIYVAIIPALTLVTSSINAIVVHKIPKTKHRLVFIRRLIYFNQYWY